MDKQSLKEMTLPEMFEVGGLLSKVIPGYTPRTPQIQATETIQRAFDNLRHAIIEAGTGTGKSYIVLLAAILWAIKNQKKAVISLPSQILQEQLYKSDLGKVMDMMEHVEESPKVALAIGRNNFLCLRKVTQLYEAVTKQLKERNYQTLLTTDELEQFKAITKKLNDPTSLGYKGDVDFEPDSKLWVKIQSSTDTCIGEKCPFYNDCYYFKNKKLIDEANVVISNNALLFSDMVVKMEGGFDKSGTLPPYHLLIFDESHNLEKDATNYFKNEISYKELLNTLLVISKSDIMDRYVKGSELEKFRSIVQKMKQLLTATSNYLFSFIELKHKQMANRNNQSEESIQNNNIVLSEEDIKKMKRYFDVLKTVFKEYSLFIKGIERQLKEIKNPSAQETLSYKKILSLSSKVQSIINKCQIVFDNIDTNESLYFIKKEVTDDFQELDKFPIWIITKTPINLGTTFQRNMFNTCDHVILLSATISTNNNFQFFRSRLGFAPDEKVEELIVDSPFDYQNQGIVYLFKNGPDTSDKAYEPYIIDNTYEILSKTEGGTFILFTSTASMQRCYAALANKIETNLNIKCLMQGQDSKSAIIKKFRDFQKPGSGYKSAILFAGSSFWEGVSVEGDDLMNVIITKLPFPVPTDPIIKARCEYIDKQAGAKISFEEYLIPLATIPLKQGFGRLIRTNKDRGNIFMLDNRLVKARYKEKILNSLPDFVYKVINIK